MEAETQQGPGGRPTLAELVNPETLQTLQERFAELGRVSIWICDPRGGFLTSPTWGHDFARLLAGSAKGRETLARRVSELAQDPSAQVRAVCFDSAALYPALIKHEGQVLGVIVVGPRPEASFGPDAVRQIAREYDVEAEALQLAAQRIESWGDDAQQATYRFADTLADTIALLYRQALEIQNQLTDLRAVYSLAELLAGTHDLQEILDLTTRNVVRALKVKAGAIRLLDEDTGELFFKSVCNLSEEYLNKGAVTLEASPIDAAAWKGELVCIEDATTDPRFRYRNEAKREGIVSGLCAPMTYRGKTVGVIRVYTDRPCVFPEAEGTLLRSIGSQAAAALIHRELYEDMLRARRVQRQLQYAGEIQRRMMPERLPASTAFEFGCVYNPTLAVGGDFYDLVELPKGHIGVCIADVMGKGIPAALMMASIRSALRAQADQIYDLDRMIGRVNQLMYRDTLPGEFATLFYGVLAPDGGRLTYCNAGHDPPLLLRGDDFIELTTGGMVLGVMANSRYERGLVELQRGDIVVLATDGVTTALDFEDRAYGRLRLRASIRRHRDLEAQQLTSQLLWDVRRFVGLADQADDTTLVVVKVR